MAPTRLTTDQQNARKELLHALDLVTPHDTPWLAIFGPGSSGKSTLVRDLSAAKLVTSNGKHVAIAYVNAAELPGYLLPWQHLLSVVLDRLGESAVPGDQSVIAALRGELLTSVQASSSRSAEATEILVANFANHFLSAYRTLAQHVFGSSQNILVIVLDHLDKVTAALATELFEAAGYFLRSPDTRLLAVSDEKTLLEKIGVLATPEPWGAKIELGKWMTLASTASPGISATRVSGASMPAMARSNGELNNDWWLNKITIVGPLISAGLGVLFVDQLSKIIMRGVPQRPILGSALQLGVATQVDISTTASLVIPLLVELVALALAGLLILVTLGDRNGRNTTAARLQQIGLALAVGALLSNVWWIQDGSVFIS